MARKMRKVALLGAFEIESEGGPPVRDGLILGSRREQKGFVLETARENIEFIVSLSRPPSDGAPLRLTQAVGKTLRTLGCEMVRVELWPITPPWEPQAEGDSPEEGASFVQGWLVFKNEFGKGQRMPMTATESIQLALAEDLPMLADYRLLQMNVAQLFEEIDAFSEQHHEEAEQFQSFVNSVTATDFARFYEKRGKQSEGEEGHE